MSNQSKEEPTHTESPAGGSAEDRPEVEILRQQLAVKEQEAKATYDRLLRQAAEFDNFKKRSLREREESVRFANEAFIKDLLPVVDNLERAVAHAQGGSDSKLLLEGVEMVLKGLFDVLSKYGVNPIDAVGHQFDPLKHEAMVQVESSDHEPNTVIEEHHKGYLFNNRLLRPALVSVAKVCEPKKNGGSEVENGPIDD
jgi:molecular chaperone GrpE